MAPSPRIVINIRDTAGASDLAWARRTLARWLVALATLMVLVIGTFPFDFSSNFAGIIHQIRARFEFTTNELFSTPESWMKFIFFMPLGFALGSLLWQWRGQKPNQIAMRCGIAILCGAFLSTVVELLQAFLSRDPSLSDILSKTCGCAAGFVIFVAVGEFVLRPLARVLVFIYKLNDARLFAAAAGTMLLLAMLAPVAARNIGNLHAWETAYPLVIGDEVDQIHFWQGAVSNIWLSAASIGDDEIEPLLASPHPDQVMRDSLVMSYHLSGAGPYLDSTGQTSELKWTPNFKYGATAGTTQPADLTGVQAIGRVGVPINGSWWLSTDTDSCTKASATISHTHAFTLVMDLATSTLNQGDGWPRIFSLANDQDHLNLELLEEYGDLEVRFRSGATGIGTDPSFIVPGVFNDNQMQRLIVSYGNGKLRVECSENGERYTLKFSPDAWLIWQIFPSSSWRYTLGSCGQAVAIAIYRMLAMFPVGVLLGAMLRIIRRGRLAQRDRIFFIAGIGGAAILLELAICLIAGGAFSLSSPICSLLAGSAGVWIVLGYLPVRQRWV